MENKPKITATQQAAVRCSVPDGNIISGPAF